MRRQFLNRRALLRRGFALVGAATGFSPVAGGGPARSRLRLLAHKELAPRQTHVDNVLVGGISGLTWDPQEDLWYALADSPWRPRCYVLRFPGLRRGQDLEPVWERVLFLFEKDGSHIHRVGFDPEGIALWRDPRSGERRFLVCSEGGVIYDVPPGIYIHDLNGVMAGELALPDRLQEVGVPGRGPRFNVAFEGIALTPDGRHAWVAMEGHLLQDASGLQEYIQNGPRRITRFDLIRGVADRQVAYVPDARLRAPFVPELVQVNGISDVLVASANRLWVLERAYFPLLGFSARIYEVELGGATDTLEIDALTKGNHVAARKRLLVDLSQVDLPVVDNFEAMSWGPVLANGNRTVVLATDDNFMRRQITQFVAFEVIPPDGHDA